MGKQNGICIPEEMQLTICPSCWDRDESYISPRCGQEKRGHEWLGEKPVGDVMHRRRCGKFTWTGDVPAGLHSGSRPYRMRNANVRRPEWTVFCVVDVWWMMADMIILSRFSLFFFFFFFAFLPCRVWPRLLTLVSPLVPCSANGWWRWE